MMGVLYEPLCRICFKSGADTFHRIVAFGIEVGVTSKVISCTALEHMEVEALL